MKIKEIMKQIKADLADDFNYTFDYKVERVTRKSKVTCWEIEYTLDKGTDDEYSKDILVVGFKDFNQYLNVSRGFQHSYSCVGFELHRLTTYIAAEKPINQLCVSKFWYKD